MYKIFVYVSFCLFVIFLHCYLVEWRAVVSLQLLMRNLKIDFLFALSSFLSLNLRFSLVAVKVKDSFL